VSDNSEKSLGIKKDFLRKNGKVAIAAKPIPPKKKLVNNTPKSGGPQVK
jgi:hypothetical protein